MLSLGLCASLKSAPRTSLFQAKTSVEYTSIKKQGGGVPRVVRENGVGAIHAEYSLHPGVRSGYMVRDRVVLAPYVSTFQKFHYSTSGTKQVVPLPPLTESISSGTVFKVEKPQGSPVSVDDVVLVVETEKIQVEVRTPYGGVIESVMVSEGDTVEVGQDLFVVMEGASAPPPQSAQEGQKPAQNVEEQKPVQSAQDVQKPAQKAEEQKPVQQDLSKKGAKGESSPQPSPRPLESAADRTDTRVRMTQARKRTAIRLKESQNTAAMLTTFNEVDMQALTDFRNLYKDRFQEKYGVKLGFMSAFAKASAVALTEIPIVNATIDGEEIVYHNYVDISVAVSTPTSLVVPVLRNVQSMSFDQIEFAINQYAKKARDNKLTIDDMSGGTFTISNGGVFGSLMGTPIINPPQSAILGMHAINKRPAVVRDQILIRPMMYLALTYDHRLIDGRDAVTFLKRIKTLIEDPTSLLLGV